MVKHTQTILPTNCLSVFGHFVWLALKELTKVLLNSYYNCTSSSAAILVDEFQLYYTKQWINYEFKFRISQHPLLFKGELQHVKFSFADSANETKINRTNKLEKISQQSRAAKESHQLEYIFELFEQTKWGVTILLPPRPFNQFINSYEFIYMKPVHYFREYYFKLKWVPSTTYAHA